jgi:hypothetical protein
MIKLTEDNKTKVINSFSDFVQEDTRRLVESQMDHTHSIKKTVFVSQPNLHGSFEIIINFKPL